MQKIDKSSASLYYRELKNNNEKNENLNLDFYLKLVMINMIVKQDNININEILDKSDQNELLLILKYTVSELRPHIQNLLQLNEPYTLNEFDILNLFGFPVTILKFRLKRIKLEIHKSLLN